MKFGFMSRILSYDGRGIQTCLEGLLRGIANVSHNHTIYLFLSIKQSIPKWALENKCQVIRIGPEPKKLISRFIWDHLSVGWACRRLGIDVLYAPAHIRPLYCSCPVAVMVPDMMYHLFPKDWSLSDRLYFRIGVSCLTARATGIIALSMNTKADILSAIRIKSSRVKVIYPGRSDDFRPLPADDGHSFREKYTLSKPFILSVGSYHPRKNQINLLKAYELIANKIPHDIIFVGAPIWQNDVFTQMAKTSPYASRMKLLGFIPRNELPHFYNNADVFVFPSRYEGFGFPVLEAMACGCPTITTNISSLPEVAGDAAILLSPDDVSGFAEAIYRVVTDFEYQKCIRRMSTISAEKFSWDKAARETIEFLEEIGQNR